MSDTKPKLTLLSSVNGGEKSPSPSAKLMLNHGKPNFTINRVKTKNETQCPFSPQNPEAASVVLKSTANSVSNGYVRPTLMKIPLSAENEVSKVVLRRTKLPEENGNGKAVQQDDEPEFVKAQRKIAERLANQNNLDFESRKSGYFTHVMISPTSPTKQLEIPVVEDHKLEKASVVEVVSDSIEPAEKPKEPIIEIKTEEKQIENEQPTENGHEHIESSQLNESADDQQKPPEVVEAAKAMIEELVQTVVKEVPQSVDESSEPAQNGVHNGNEDVVTNGNHSEENHSEANNHNSQNGVELSSEPNKYPETVKVVTETQTSIADELLQDMYKKKFDIHADSEDIKVVPTVPSTEQ